MKRQTVYISTLAAILLTAGCQKAGFESQGRGDGTVRYAVVMDDDTQTKGMLVNTDGSDKALSEFATAIGGTFTAKAYNGATHMYSKIYEGGQVSNIPNPRFYGMGIRPVHD